MAVLLPMHTRYRSATGSVVGHEHASRLPGQHGISNPITGRNRCIVVNGRSVRRADVSKRNELREQKALNSFNQFISLCDEERRHFETKRLGGLGVDSQHKFSRQLNRKLRRHGATQNAIDIGR
jgi:hypothetical protein